MYGTVMIARLADGVSADDVQKAGVDWRQSRQVAGFVDDRVLQADDGRIVLAVRFESKDAYLKLADDPAQDEWWTNTMRPMLAADPEWIDGEWTDI
jgi:hypothetical protein